jgi:hypothetical protein
MTMAELLRSVAMAENPAVRRCGWRNGFYLEDFADQLVALLPEWTRWLASRNATPPELADRCLPYAKGKPHPQVAADEIGPGYLARVTE